MDGSLVHDTAAQAAEKVVAGHVKKQCISLSCTGVHRAGREPTDLSAPPKQSKKASAMSLRCGYAANILFPDTTAQSPWLDATGAPAQC